MAEEEGSSVTIRFVLPKGKNETTCSDELGDAFTLCQDNQMSPEWVSEDDVLELNPGKTVNEQFFDH